MVMNERHYGGINATAANKPCLYEGVLSAACRQIVVTRQLEHLEHRLPISLRTEEGKLL